MNLAHLTLEQTPPLSVPFRFFLTAPFFGILASLLILYEGLPLLNHRWSLEVLALTHLVTLGLISMVMMGAMLQLLPVLAGALIPRPRLVSTFLHLFQTLGSLSLSLGFFIHHKKIIFLGMLLLGLGFLIFLGLIGYCLIKRGKANSPIVIAMRFALLSLGFTVSLGLGLGTLFSHDVALPLPYTLTHLHLTWGLAGWVGLLIIGVAYQVVPMFQITPHYSPKLTRWFVPSLFLSLIVWSVCYFLSYFSFLPHFIPQILSSLLALGFGLFASVTLYLQSHRLRRLPDVTLNYWRVGMGGLLLAISLWIGGLVWSPLTSYSNYDLLLGSVLIGGGILPIIQGMLYKIIPFLVWLHLQHCQLKASTPIKLIQLPHMKQIIPDKQAYYQFWMYLVGISLFGGTLLGLSSLIEVAGTILMLSFLFLGYNLYRALWLYLSVRHQIIGQVIPSGQS